MNGYINDAIDAKDVRGLFYHYFVVLATTVSSRIPVLYVPAVVLRLYIYASELIIHGAFFEIIENHIPHWTLTSNLSATRMEKLTFAVYCRVCERAPIPADSAYFTTSESKAKMLTRLRGNNETLHDGFIDQQQLYKKKVS